MTIQVGDKLPEATFRTMTADGPAARTTAEIFAGKTIVVIIPSPAERYLSSWLFADIDLESDDVEHLANAESI